MRHHILPEKLYNILVINQTNLFIQNDDEVRTSWRLVPATTLQIKIRCAGTYIPIITNSSFGSLYC